MSFPWLFESNFETGVFTAEWTTETDTGALIDPAHYRSLAQMPFSQAAPYRGAYAARVQMGDTNDHTLTQTGFTVASDGNTWTRFYVCLGNDLTASAADDWSILEYQTATNAINLAVMLGLSAGITGATKYARLGLNSSLGTTWSTIPMEVNKWHALEVAYNTALNSTDGANKNDSTQHATLYLNGYSVAVADNTSGGTFNQLVLGTQDTLSTTSGTILFDQFIQDDARVYPIVDRFSTTIHLTKSSHIAVGACRIDNVTLHAGAAADGVVTIFDTDRGNTNDASKIKVRLSNVTSSDMIDPAGMPVSCQRGCYVQLAGTNPRATIILSMQNAMSAATVRNVGLTQPVRPLEVF